MRRFLPVLLGALTILGVVAVPASAASHKTYHFFSKEVSSKGFDSTGKRITDPKHAPVVGDSFISTDNDYLGNHKKHSKRLFATDHIICTFTKVDVAHNSLTARCDAQIALPGGMLIVDRTTLNFGPAKSVIPINSGTGKFAKLKRGRVTTISYSQKSDNSDLIVSATY